MLIYRLRLLDDPGIIEMTAFSLSNCVHCLEMNGL